MSQSFEAGLRAHLESLPKITLKQRRFLRIMDLPADNPRRFRVLRHMEMSARAEMDDLSDIDWSEVDWEEIFKKLDDLWQQILALFGK